MAVLHESLSQKTTSCGEGHAATAQKPQKTLEIQPLAEPSGRSGLDAALDRDPPVALSLLEGCEVALVLVGV